MSTNIFNTTAITSSSLNDTNTVDAQFNLAFASRDNKYKRTFDPSIGSGYKRDYRLTGRYFNLEVAMSGANNPELTGMDLEVIPSGTR